jgi:hypothetical protein
MSFSLGIICSATIFAVLVLMSLTSSESVGIGFISMIYLLTKILSLLLQAARIERIISKKEFL